MKGKTLWNKIKEKRIALDLTQQQVSVESGVDLCLIKDLEVGKVNVSLKELKAVLKVIKLPVEEVYFKDFKDTKVIAVANNKGGSGKTSVVSGLGYNLTKEGYKVLLVDTDMQMNLTRSFNFDRDDFQNIFEAIDKELNLKDFIISTNYENLDFVRSDLKMSTIEMRLFTKISRENIFKQILKPIIEEGIYDFILIDTNPTLGILNFNILNATDHLIIPVEMTRFGVEGLDILLNYCHDVRRTNPDLKIAGVVRNKVDKRESITQAVDDVIKEVFGDIMFKSYIGVDTNIKKAQWESTPLNLYDKNSKAAKQFESLTKEVIKIVK